MYHKFVIPLFYRFQRSLMIESGEFHQDLLNAVISPNMHSSRIKEHRQKQLLAFDVLCWVAGVHISEPERYYGCICLVAKWNSYRFTFITSLTCFCHETCLFTWNRPPICLHIVPINIANLYWLQEFQCQSTNVIEESEWKCLHFIDTATLVSNLIVAFLFIYLKNPISRTMDSFNFTAHVGNPTITIPFLSVDIWALIIKVYHICLLVMYLFSWSEWVCEIV